MPMSAMRKLIPFANQAVKEKNLELIKLNLGQPDIPTPDVFWDAIKEYSTSGRILAYGGSKGIPRLLEALVGYYSKFNIDLTQEQMIVTIGGCEAILIALQAITDPGDNVLVFEPFYSNYKGVGAMCGCDLISITTEASEQYHLPPREQIEAAINDKTRAIMYASPGNPTGTVYTKEEVQMLTDICREKNIFLLADEVYREFSYDGDEITSAFHIDDVDDFVILLDSFSKRYSACGARVGVIGCKNEAVYHSMLKVATVRLSGPVVEQVGIAACIEDGVEDYLKDVFNDYISRRNYLVGRLNEMPNVTCLSPSGAFYAMANLGGIKTEHFCKWVLTDFEFEGKTVLVSPGAGFYTTPGYGESEIRIAYVLNKDRLKTALDVLEKAIIAYHEQFPAGEDNNNN
eukprot:TRINITY_DN1266_c0_g1_i1.p1 TRINITY_DN1266_c0_g1~~TRINITY_DN1266_c0_g1_i1.p1  ORF type:complete len:427 (+),score=185.79 TRINITY_DN1266_c0_g1_i1:76-1281(+)